MYTLFCVCKSRVEALQTPTTPLNWKKKTCLVSFFDSFCHCNTKNLLKTTANDATEEDEGTLCNCMLKACLIKINLEKQRAKLNGLFN